MYKKAIIIITTLILTSCINNTTRGTGASHYATKDAEVVFGAEQTYPRIALIIGNNNYQKSRRLTNAVPDARAMRDFFQNRGFQVVYAENADRDTMISKVDEFMGGLSKKSVAVIYYSGHATQDKSRLNGAITNYLVPVNDRRLTSITDYDRDAISMNYILSKADELNHGLNIAMLDGCRTSIGKGNGVIQNFGAEGVYTVYATASGVTASDSGQFRMSFLKHAQTPLKLNDIFLAVKRDLIGTGQKPSIIDDSNGGLFYFSKPEIQPRVIPQKVVVPQKIVTSSSKWITPTDKEATWAKAKKICRDSGGRLPSIDELRKVVTDCGGEIKDNSSEEWNRNEKNNSYQSCYKKKGFSSDCYWSSTTNVSNSSVAWLVIFNNGIYSRGDKGSEYRVRCVRGRQ